MRHQSSLILAVLAVFASCGTASNEPRSFVLATTTSVEDSGLMDALLPAFDSVHPDVDVRLVAVGSGEALAMGMRRDADLLLTHAPWDEAQFMMAGHGQRKRDVMHNWFVIVGPSSDPAGVRGAANAAAAMRSIADHEAMFFTRGDSSGTHRKELGLWQEAQAVPDADLQPWYVESGVGMGDLLRIAGERGGYTVADRATALRFQEHSGLDILYEDETDDLYNPYSAILVTGAANTEAAQVFLEWLTSEDARRIIRAFGADTFGRPLFVSAEGP